VLDWSCLKKHNKILFLRVSLNDSDLSKCLQQVLSYLEYLKFEFLRHMYLLKSYYCIQTSNLFKTFYIDET